jgi:transposase
MITYVSSWSSTIFLVCEWCGNKRCPHADNKAFKCTESNERVQKVELLAWDEVPPFLKQDARS